MRLNQVTIGSTNLESSESFYDVSEAEQVTVYFECDEIDDEYKRLRGAGAEFEHPPTDMPWLWREARLRDPDGHRLCIFRAGENRKNPPWRLPSP